MIKQHVDYLKDKLNGLLYGEDYSNGYKRALEEEIIILENLITNNRLVIIESPYSGHVELNKRYAQHCMRDSILKGEIPFASHLLYTQPNILNDNNFKERAIGINAGFEWGKYASKTVVYQDLGISKGMKEGIKIAEKEEREIEYRNLPNFDIIFKSVSFYLSIKLDSNKQRYYGEARIQGSFNIDTKLLESQRSKGTFLTPSYIMIFDKQGNGYHKKNRAEIKCKEKLISIASNLELEHFSIHEYK